MTLLQRLCHRLFGWEYVRITLNDGVPRVCRVRVDAFGEHYVLDGFDGDRYLSPNRTIWSPKGYGEIGTWEPLTDGSRK